MYYSDYYNNNSLDRAMNQAAGVGMWVVVSFILAIIGGILVYFLFIKSDNKLSDNMQKLKDLLDFKIMLIEPILKIVYLMLTIFIILVSFSLITVNFLAFILVLVLGPIGIRIAYELALIMVMLWKNTKEINDKLKQPKEAKEIKKETKKEEK